MEAHVVRMPDENVLTKRINTTPLPLKQAGVLKRFIHSIADQNETGSTLVFAWESACHDANRKLPPRIDYAIAHMLNAYSFPEVADLLIPDPKIAAEAKEELQFLEELRA